MVFFWLAGAAFAGCMWGIWIALASEPAKWWELWTAIGTVSLALITTWLTYRQASQSARERSRRAEMALAAVIPAMEELSTAASIAATLARQRAMLSDGTKIPVWQRHTLNTVLDTVLESATLTASDLALEESSRGVQLARIIAQLPKLEKKLRLLLSFEDEQPVGGDIQAFVFLMSVCSLGRAVNKVLMRSPQKIFEENQYVKLRERLHLNDFRSEDL